MLEVVFLYVLREVVYLHGGQHGGQREHGGAVPHRGLAVERALRVQQDYRHLPTQQNSFNLIRQLINLISCYYYNYKLHILLFICF